MKTKCTLTTSKIKRASIEELKKGGYIFSGTALIKATEAKIRKNNMQV